MHQKALVQVRESAAAETGRLEERVAALETELERCQREKRDEAATASRRRASELDQITGLQQELSGARAQLLEASTQASRLRMELSAARGQDDSPQLRVGCGG